MLPLNEHKRIRSTNTTLVDLSPKTEYTKKGPFRPFVFEAIILQPSIQLQYGPKEGKEQEKDDSPAVHCAKTGGDCAQRVKCSSL